jgi:hypothetical protein
MWKTSEPQVLKEKLILGKDKYEDCPSKKLVIYVSRLHGAGKPGSI